MKNLITNSIIISLFTASLFFSLEIFSNSVLMKESRGVFQLLTEFLGLSSILLIDKDFNYKKRIGYSILIPITFIVLSNFFVEFLIYYAQVTKEIDLTSAVFILYIILTQVFILQVLFLIKKGYLWLLK